MKLYTKSQLTGIIIICSIITLLTFGYGIYHANAYMYSPEKATWRDEVYSHNYMAQASETPEGVKAELQATIDGMYAVGLTPNSYSTVKRHRMIYRNSVAYHIDYYDNIIDLCDDTIEWRESYFGNITVSTDDVYAKKVDHLQEQVNDLYTMTQCEDAYIIQYYPQTMYSGAFILVGACYLLSTIFLLFARGEADYCVERGRTTSDYSAPMAFAYIMLLCAVVMTLIMYWWVVILP